MKRWIRRSQRFAKDRLQSERLQSRERAHILSKFEVWACARSRTIPMLRLRDVKPSQSMLFSSIVIRSMTKPRTAAGDIHRAQKTKREPKG